MGGQLATGSSIYMASAGVPAADGAGLSSIKSFSQLLTSIAAMPLAGGTFIGHVLFTDNTYDIGASGATRPRTVYAGTSVITPLLNNSNAAALTLGNSTYGVTVPGAATFSGDISMQKATQGYIRSHGPAAVGRYTEMYHDDAQGYVKSNFGGLVLNPAGIVYVGELSAVSAGGKMRVGYSTDTWTVFNGHTNYNAGVRIFAKTTTSQGLGVSGLPGQTSAIFSCDDSGGNQLFSVEPGGGARSWGAYNTKYTQTIHDGTNGILSTSSGNLNLTPAGGTVAVTGAVTASGTVTVGTYTVATLPAAGSNAYSNANVSDSNAAASGNYGATVAGGGSNKVRVFSDGTNWVIA